FPWWVGLGVAWNAALVLLTRALHAPFTVLATLAPWTSLAGWGLVWSRARRAPAPAGGAAPRLAGGAWAIVLGATLLATLHAGRIGAPMEYSSDSPDHIGTVRRMIASGDAFPTDAFFKDAGVTGADPRKGLWHPQVALIAMLAHVDPADAWRQLPAVMAPIFILNAAQLGWLSRGAAGAAVFAVVDLVLLAGSIPWFPLRKGVYSTFLADQIALAAAIAVLADQTRPSRAARAVAVGLGLGAIACHLYSVIQFAMVFGALAAGLA